MLITTRDPMYRDLLCAVREEYAKGGYQETEDFKNSLRVMADYLLEKGDPRGEAIALELKKDKTPKDKQRLSELEKILWNGFSRKFNPNLLTQKIKYGFPFKIYVGNPMALIDAYDDGYLSVMPTIYADRFYKDFVDQGYDVLLRALDLPIFLNLTSLNFDHRRLDASIVEGLVSKKYLRNIRDLSFYTCYMGNKGAIVLSSSKYLQNLVGLNLSLNFIDETGAEAIAMSSSFPSLKKLNLSNNAIKDKGKNAIEESMKSGPLKGVEIVY